MLEGWYCRSMANNNADAEEEEDEDEEEEEEEEEDSPEEEVPPNYKDQYRNLKRKLKFLIYENECFQEALRSTQRKLLKVNRDKSFLLDRLLQYEKVDASFSESDETESSDDDDSAVAANAAATVTAAATLTATPAATVRYDVSKRKKMESSSSNHTCHQASTTVVKAFTASKKKKAPTKVTKTNNVPIVQSNNAMPMSLMSDGHMTPEEVERHLESRQTYLELVPEKAPPTVPTEMFSNDPSLDSESNEIGELETSPSNMGEDCLSVDTIAE